MFAVVLSLPFCAVFFHTYISCLFNPSYTWAQSIHVFSSYDCKWVIFCSWIILVHDPCGSFGSRAMSFEFIHRGEFEIELHPSRQPILKVARRSTSNTSSSLSVWTMMVGAYQDLTEAVAADQSMAQVLIFVVDTANLVWDCPFEFCPSLSFYHRSKPSCMVSSLCVSTAFRKTLYLSTSGIHVALFCVCMKILIHRRTKQYFILASAIFMFLLSTVDIALTMRVLTYDLSKRMEPESQQVTVFKNPIFVTNK